MTALEIIAAIKVVRDLGAFIDRMIQIERMNGNISDEDIEMLEAAKTASREDWDAKQAEALRRLEASNK